MRRLERFCGNLRCFSDKPRYKVAIRRRTKLGAKAPAFETDGGDVPLMGSKADILGGWRDVRFTPARLHSSRE